MPLPAMLTAALPYLGTAAAGYAGQKLAGGDTPGLFSGKPERTVGVPKFQPQQEQTLDQLLSMGMSGLGDFGTQARQRFQQQTIPTLAERFTSMGSGSSLSSPAFAGQLGQAGAGLESELAGLDIQKALQLLQLGLQPQQERLFMPEQPSPLGSSLAAAAPGILMALIKYIGSQQQGIL